jgi:hypothetical protein
MECLIKIYSAGGKGYVPPDVAKEKLGTILERQDRVHDSATLDSLFHLPSVPKWQENRLFGFALMCASRLGVIKPKGGLVVTLGPIDKDTVELLTSELEPVYARVMPEAYIPSA